MFQTGGFPDLDLSFLFCPFLSFWDFPGDFPDLLGEGPGIFPICPFPLSRPIKSTYEEQSRKGPRHNLDLSRKKWETPGFGKHPGLACLKRKGKLRKKQGILEFRAGDRNKEFPKSKERKGQGGGDQAPSTRKPLAIAIVRLWCAKLLAHSLPAPWSSFPFFFLRFLAFLVFQGIPFIWSDCLFPFKIWKKGLHEEFWGGGVLGVKCKFPSLNFVKEFRRFLGSKSAKIG